MEYGYVKLSNAQRNKKTAGNKKFGKSWTQKSSALHFQRTNNIYTKKRKIFQRLGYEFEDTESQILHQMKQTFQNKVNRYFGQSYIVQRLDADQKRNKKEEMNLVFKRNPILQKFQRVNKFLSLKEKKLAFQYLKSQLI